MRKKSLRPLLLCLFGLCLILPQAGSCMDGNAPDAPVWEGDYLGKSDILRIGSVRDGRAFDFRFEDRESAAQTRQGQAEAEERSPRRAHGRDVAFSLSPNGGVLTVGAGKKSAHRQGGDAKLAGRYRRLDSLEVRKDRLVPRQSGRPLPDGLATLRPVENAAMRFAVIPGYAVEEYKLPLRPGLYLAAPDGAVRYFTGGLSGGQEAISPEEFGDMTDAVSLSPDKDILAVSMFGAQNGEWLFFSWPDLKPLEHPRVRAFKDDKSPGLLWSGGRRVVVDAMDVAGSGRQCGYDPCGPISVVAHDLETGTSKPVFTGTGLCDYRVQSVTGGEVTAGKLCLRQVGDWANYPENVPTQTVRAPLP